MWLAPGLIPVREFVSADGSRRLAIFRRPDGLFGFAGERLTTENGDTFWEPCDGSGIYQTFDAAERAAVAEITWFGNENSN
jgi:hypothetical protein